MLRTKETLNKCWHGRSRRKCPDYSSSSRDLDLVDSISAKTSALLPTSPLCQRPTSLPLAFIEKL